jgi:hypothetical protein
MFCFAAIKVKDGEKHSDVITIKEESGKKSKIKEVIYRQCTRKIKEKDLCGLHLKKKDIIMFNTLKKDKVKEPSSWAESSSSESSDDEEEFKIKDDSSSSDEETTDDDFILDETYNYSSDIAIAIDKIISRVEKKTNKQESFEKIRVSIQEVGKTYYYDDEKNTCYKKKDDILIFKGILLRVECNKAPIIKNGEFYSITNTLICNKYIFQKCIITNNVYCPNEALQWIKIGVYQNGKII